MYKAIGFDLGGVIIRYAAMEQLAFIASELGVGQTELMTPYRRVRPLLDAGQITNREFWSAIVKESGSKLDPDATAHLWNDRYVPDSPIMPGMLELVSQLKASGYKVGMFSNIDSEHAADNQDRHIFEHFDKVIFSYRAKVAKPDPEAYRILARELGVQTKQLVFIDDLETNVVGANQAGCRGIRFLDYDQLVEELEGIGIKL